MANTAINIDVYYYKLIVLWVFFCRYTNNSTLAHGDSMGRCSQHCMKIALASFNALINIPYRFSPVSPIFLTYSNRSESE